MESSARSQLKRDSRLVQEGSELSRISRPTPYLLYAVDSAGGVVELVCVPNSPYWTRGWT